MKSKEIFKKHLAHVYIMQELMGAFAERLTRRARQHDSDKLEDSIGHYVNADHHVQYWHKRDEKMPLTAIIEMYFNQVAHHIQEGTDFNKEMETLVKRLKDLKQGHAVVIIQLVYNEFPPSMFEKVG